MTDQVTDILKDDKAGDDAAKQADQSAKKPEGSQVDINEVLKDQLDSIVNENGERKYKDVVTALESIKYKEQHIDTLQSELKTLREKTTQDDTLEQALKNMSARQDNKGTTDTEVLSAEKIKAITEEALQEREEAARRKNNRLAVSSELVKKYGDEAKAKEAYQKKAEELGMPLSTLISLAEVSPTAAIAYFKTTGTSQELPKGGSVNTQSLDNDQKGEIDYAARYTSSSDPSISRWREAVEKTKLK